MADLDAPCAPNELFAVVGDLERYPDWLSIVPRAVPDGVGDDGAPAWAVELRGRLGPLARSKRLRMVRTVDDAPTHVRFERREHDGRDHSAWVLDASVHEHPDGSRLEMRLHYGGSFGGVLLERMLRDEIERSKPRLLALLAGAAR
ncbi:MAG: SRPBCC family protein [Acidimicrobiales bacterium]|nr:SRPBCC family protein [Acidimicrobiales bacterium]